MEFYQPERMLGHSTTRMVPSFNAWLQANRGSASDQRVWFCAVSQVMQAAHQWPHYKVWPEYVPPLAQVPLTGVLLRDFKSPFPSFVVQLPTVGDGLLFDGQPVRTLTLVDYVGLDLGKALKRLQPEYGDPTGKTNDRNLALIIERSNRPDEPECIVPITDWMSPHKILVERPDETIEETLASLAKDQQEDDRNKPIQHVDPDDFVKCWRLASAVAFMATGQHRLIQPDVLNKDLAAYLAAFGANNQEKINHLHNKATARRHGERGWTIGRLHQIFVGKPSGSTADSEPSGRELTKQHIRSAHYHTYWTGPGRTVKVVRFVLPTVVRPDLPLPTDSPDRVIRKLQDEEPSG